MADKFLRNNAGIVTEKEATVISAGAGNAGQIVALDVTGKLDNSVMPTGIGIKATIAPASEALTAGNFVNLWNDAGTLKVRKADATTSGKYADGFVLAAVAQGNNATVYLEGINTQITGLTGGTQYYLATTAGGVTATAPSASGNIVQRIGKGFSATEIGFEPSQPIVLA